MMERSITLMAALAFVSACAGSAETATRPPPPPPPPAVQYESAPAVIVSFIRAHEADAGAWQVTVRRRSVAVEMGNELVRRLVDDHSYVSGEYGCAEPKREIEIRRGDAVLPLAVSCGHLYVTPQEHVTLAPAMVQFIDRL